MKIVSLSLHKYNNILLTRDDIKECIMKKSGPIG